MTQQQTLIGCSLEEKQFIDKKIEGLIKIFTTPLQVGLEGGGSPLKINAIVEKMGKLLKAENKEEIKKAVTELTDAEILTKLSNTSLRVPLNTMGFEAMKFYFKRVKGKEAYKEVFGDEEPNMSYVKQFKREVLHRYED